MRLLLTGAGGFVGGSVVAQAGPEWEAHALTRGGAPLERDNVRWHALDPLNFDALGRAVRGIAPDVIMHAAAIADIDFCEAHRDEALRVNVEWTRRMAALAVELGARFLYLSTDNAFDGEHGPYAEEDRPVPANFYGRTKVIGEEITSALAVPWVIARVSIVMGLPLGGAGNSFLSRMLAKWEKGEAVGVPPVEVRSPVDVVTLGRALLELAGNDFTGFIHLSGNDILNRCDLVRRIAKRLGYPEDWVVPNDPVLLPGRAPRPRDVSLSNAKARRALRTPMRGVEDGLDLILSMRG